MSQTLRRLAMLAAVLFFLGFSGWFTLVRMPGKTYRGTLQPLTGAAIGVPTTLEHDVVTMTSDIGSRNFVHYDNLNATKEFIQLSLRQTGYEVHQQAYDVKGQTYYNLEAEHLGSKHPNEIIIIGAHYDTVSSAPGADDNATGTAAVIELARQFAQRETNRTVRFVAFTNEEPPFFWSSEMGSLVYANRSRQRQETIVAMVSLDMLGYFSDVDGSQRYPFPGSLFYPSTGNFISFVGNLSSGALVRDAIAAFRQQANLPSEGIVLPGWVAGVGYSDHWSFWQQGYQAIMVTDSGFYRYPYYHTTKDTSDKINFDRFSRVVLGLVEVIDALAN